jgi:hypothetical protein
MQTSLQETQAQKEEAAQTAFPEVLIRIVSF